jgi:hypothetical protein
MTKVKIRVHKHPIDRHGYDAQGKYWGVPNNLYEAEIDGPHTYKFTYVRASSNKEAKEKLKDWFFQNQKISRDVSRKPARDTETLKRCPVGTEIQSLILDNRFFDRRDALGWVRRHGFQAHKIDETSESFRFRQIEPSHFGPKSFRTIILRPGVKAVVGCPR